MSEDWFEQLEAEYARWHEEAGSDERSVPNALYKVLSDELKDLDEVLVHRLTYGDALAFLVVTGDSAMFVRPVGEGATIHFLGSLARGTYAETVHYTEKAIEVDSVFEHGRLPGREVRLRRVIPDPNRVHIRPWERQGLMRTERLEAILRKWAEAPSPSETHG